MNSDANDPDARLEALGISLSPPRPPIANFVHAVESGNLLFVSGQGPREADGSLHTGKVGADISAETAYQHARIAGCNLIAVLASHLGRLRRVQRIVKILGMVNAVPEFKQHPLVINGCSDLMIEVFGPRVGSHARSAVGVSSLPGGITVEVELVAEVLPSPDK
jgi:enamine deaminase RidA (YjgF/YER057c/UK114 family)